MIKRSTLLKYIPNNFQIERQVNLDRIFYLNKNYSQNAPIIYFCEREIRVKDNFALQFAIQKSEELNLPLKIICPKTDFEYGLKQKFIEKQILKAKAVFLEQNLDFEIVKNFSEHLKNSACIIKDFNPVSNRDLHNFQCEIIEIDGHNIVPARFVSGRQEYSAATLRRKIYYNIYPFLTEYDNFSTRKVEADEILEKFIKDKLPDYAEFKNDPNKDVLSGLSKYLNTGFISSQRVALEVIKSDVSDINKEVFLEELIVRKELADNFCLYCRDYKSFECIPEWAKISIQAHKFDIRPYVYSLEELETAKTHDILWNATQNQLVLEGVIHGYLRMYWAKKIMEWTNSPDEALNRAIYLNDKYGFDSPSANGYVGILWALGGLHDRAFADYPVTGKIRRMTFNSLKTKFNISEYIEKYG